MRILHPFFLAISIASLLSCAQAALVSHYTFDDPANIGSDSGSLKNDGMLAGSAQHSDDSVLGGGALFLDGNSDYLNVGGGADLSAIDDNGEGFTLAAWIKPNSASGVRRIFSTGMFAGFQGQGWGAGLSGSSPFATTYGRADFNSDVSIVPVGAWTHVAYVYRPVAGQIRFYVDGALVATETGAGGMNDATTYGFIIGGLALPGNGQWFNGRIDDLRIYDTELATAEVEVLADPDSATPVAITNLFANPAPLAVAGSTTLSWSASGATLMLDGGEFSDLDVTGQSSIETSPVVANTIYTLTASNAVSSTSRQITVAVDASPLDPIINEFVASNTVGLVDEDGDFSDWIEIYNPNPYEFSLADWHLTDNLSRQDKWQFPAISIAGNGYLIVFASDKDRDTPGAELHTNFKLSAGGEYLALTRQDQTVAAEFAPSFPAQGSDFSYGSSANSFYFVPTPGTANGQPLSDLPPRISDVTENPPAPMPAEALPVEATVQGVGAGGVASVTLHYRVGFGAEQTLAMSPGAENLFSATIPASAYEAGDMVRWYVTSVSGGGSMAREPLFDDPIESSQYFGTVVQDPSVATALPVLQWFVDNASASETRTGTQASLFFNGEFYDNIYCRTRGQSAGSWPKHKFKFDFYKGGHFRWDAEQPRVEEFNLQSFYREMFTQSANTSYMREPLMFWWMAEAGVAAPAARHLHVRRNGEFYGLFAFIEQIDEDFLTKHGYSATGPLYKAAWQSGGPATLSVNPQPGQYRKSLLEEEPFDDLAAFCAGINGADRNTYLWDNVNVAQWINVLAAMNVPFNHDQLTKNYYVYLEPETGLWQRFPWDADQSFPIGQYITGENWTNPLYGDTQHTQELSGGNPNPAWQNHMHDLIMDNPVTREMYLRRVKTLADRYLAEAGSGTAFLIAGSTASYLVPIDSTLDSDWSDLSFDDSGWASGPGGFGFENIPSDYAPLIGTVVKPRDTNVSATTVLLRYHFELSEAQIAEIESLTLRMKWDDGFVASLNGVEIARDRVTGSPTWNTQAASRSDILNNDYVDFNVSPFAGQLVAGDNVLAIRSVNSRANNSDMLLVAELIGGQLPYFEALAESTRALIKPDADADRSIWAARGVTLSAIESGMNEILNVSLPMRREQLFDIYSANGSTPLLPGSGVENPSLSFGLVEYNPSSGNQDEEFVEIVNNEAVAVDLSGWSLDGGVTHMFEPGTLIVGGGSLFVSPDVIAFRARSISPRGGESRFVLGNYSGHLSNLGEVLDLRDAEGALIATTTTPSDPSDNQRFLVISEIMYHPADPNPDAEFIELLNVSDSVTLDLSGVAFTAGIDYVFPAPAMLVPGGRVVINFGEFLSFSRLGNGGDRIKLEDADGSTIREFSYDDALPWPPSADGGGPSLVLISPDEVPDHGVAANWRPSATVGGNPGTNDTVAFTGNPDADSDGDGIGAFAEYGLGTSDSVAGGSPLSVERSAAGDLEVTFPLSLTAEGARAALEVSSDLSSWFTPEPAPVLTSDVYDPSSGIRRQTWTIPAVSAERFFVRIRFTSTN